MITIKLEKIKQNPFSMKSWDLIIPNEILKQIQAEKSMWLTNPA